MPYKFVSYTSRFFHGSMVQLVLLFNILGKLMLLFLCSCVDHMVNYVLTDLTISILGPWSNIMQI